MQSAIKKIAACRGIGIEDDLLADPVWCRKFLDTHAKESMKNPTPTLAMRSLVNVIAKVNNEAPEQHLSSFEKSAAYIKKYLDKSGLPNDDLLVEVERVAQAFEAEVPKRYELSVRVCEAFIARFH